MNFDFSIQSFGDVIGILVDVGIVVFLIRLAINSFCDWNSRRKSIAKLNAEFKKQHTVMVRQRCSQCKYCRKTYSPGMRGRYGRMVPSYCTKFRRNLSGDIQALCYSKLLDEIEWRILK